LVVRVDGENERQSVARAHKLLPEIEKLVHHGFLAGIDSVATAIPPQKEQEAVLDLLRRVAPRRVEIRHSFEEALRFEGLNPTAFAPGLDRMETALVAKEALSLESLAGTRLGRGVSRYYAAGAFGSSVAIYCYPMSSQVAGTAANRLELLTATLPSAVVTGPIAVSADLRRMVGQEATRVAVLGLGIVFLLLTLEFRSAIDGALSLLPLAGGLLLMLGTMALLGLELNLLNAFVLTMIFGIAVDYGIHVLHRWRESGGDPEAVATTCGAILLSALTTIAGFGSLVLSHFPGLRSMGQAAIIGALASAVLAVTALPALLCLLQKGRQRGSSRSGSERSHS
jgi:predicted exporter